MNLFIPVTAHLWWAQSKKPGGPGFVGSKEDAEDRRRVYAGSGYSRQKGILLVHALLYLVILRLELPQCPLAKFAEHLTFKQPSLQTHSHLLSDGFGVNM